jgi:hypothetical protein
LAFVAAVALSGLAAAAASPVATAPGVRVDASRLLPDGGAAPVEPSGAATTGWQWRDDDDDDGTAPGGAHAASGELPPPGPPKSTQLEVSGPVKFHLVAQSGQVELVSGGARLVRATLTGARASSSLSLVRRGDHLEVQFGDHRQLRGGLLRIELPVNSSAEINSGAADILLDGQFGEVLARTRTGQVHAAHLGTAEIDTISGDVIVDAASGPLRIHTDSGDATIVSTEAVAALDFSSTTGGLNWQGLCAKGCRLSAESSAGELNFALEAKSSFELTFGSRTGDLHDTLPLVVHRQLHHRPNFGGGWTEAGYGKSEGIIECDTLSGDLSLRPR